MGKLTFVPLRWLIKEEHDSFGVILLELLLQRLIGVSWLPHCLLTSHLYVWEKDFHATRTFRTKYIGFILNHSVLCSDLISRLCLVGVVTSIIDVKLCAQEVRSHLSKVSLRFFTKFLLLKTDQIVWRCLSCSLLTIQQELISIREGQNILGEESVEAWLNSLNRASDLPYSWWYRLHIHIF